MCDLEHHCVFRPTEVPPTTASEWLLATGGLVVTIGALSAVIVLAFLAVSTGWWAQLHSFVLLAGLG